MDNIQYVIDQWKCETGVKWELAGSTDINSATPDDNTNVIYLAEENEFTGSQSGAIAFVVITGRIQQCDDSDEAYRWNMDLAIRKSTNWHIDDRSDAITVPSTKLDFLSNIIHELGHCHSLVHVNNIDDVMYFDLYSGTKKRSLNPNDIEGGLNVIEASSALTTCGGIQQVMPIGQSFPSGCNPNNVNEITLENFVRIYPTLFDDSINIEIIGDGYDRKIHKFEMVDVIGNRVLSKTFTTSQKKETVTSLQV